MYRSEKLTKLIVTSGPEFGRALVCVSVGGLPGRTHQWWFNSLHRPY